MWPIYMGAVARNIVLSSTFPCFLSTPVHQLITEQNTQTVYSYRVHPDKATSGARGKKPKSAVRMVVVLWIGVYICSGPVATGILFMNSSVFSVHSYGLDWTRLFMKNMIWCTGPYTISQDKKVTPNKTLSRFDMGSTCQCPQNTERTFFGAKCPISTVWPIKNSLENFCVYLQSTGE